LFALANESTEKWFALANESTEKWFALANESTEKWFALANEHTEKMHLHLARYGSGQSKKGLCGFVVSI
jgi:hypothetical protein